MKYLYAYLQDNGVVNMKQISPGIQLWQIQAANTEENYSQLQHTKIVDK